MTEVNDRGSGDYALVPDVIWLRAADGSSRLFDLETSSYGLNESATRMLDGILGGTTGETIQKLAREFQVDQTTIKTDLADLVGRLADSRLIAPRDSTRSKDRTSLQRLAGGTFRLI